MSFFNNMNYLFLLCVFGLLCKIVRAEDDVFENSTALCTKRCLCSTQDDNSTLSIDCIGRSMKHTIANWPEHSKTLKATFRGNEITTLEPMPGSSAESLQLVFSYCKIKYLRSGLFESTVNVKLVDLSHNLLTSSQLGSDVFKGPYNNSYFEPIALEHLDLSYNEIHSLSNKLFMHTPNLNYLNLAGNKFRVLDHQTCLALSSINLIKVLNLGDNDLNQLPVDVVKNLPNLTEIDLSNNALDDIPESLQCASNSLEILNVSGNPIGEINDETFGQLHFLRRLFANELHKLSRVKARSFSHLPRLKVVELSRNTLLVDIDARAFEDVGDSLVQVNLDDNSLKRLPFDLLPWERLNMLNIANNDLACDCDLYKIVERLPERIKYRNFDVPTCIDRMTLRNLEIYALTNETCSTRALEQQMYGVDQQTYRFTQIALTSLSIILAIAACVSMWIAYMKWKLYRRTSKYPFPSNNPIVYTPLQQPIVSSTA